jgi:hypothetical protein
MSPNGKQIAFSDLMGTTYLVGINGGTPQKLAEDATAPDWSPDGNYVAATVGVSDSTSASGFSYVLKRIDVHTGQVLLIPDSKNKIGPWYISADAVVAAALDQSKFLQFDFKTQKWTDFIAGPGPFVNWETSADRKYFFYGIGGNDSKLFRMKLSDHSVEEITSLKNFAGIDNPALSVSPDDSAVVTRNIGSQEVYALTVKWP